MTPYWSLTYSGISIRRKAHKTSASDVQLSWETFCKIPYLMCTSIESHARDLPEEVKIDVEWEAVRTEGTRGMACSSYDVARADAEQGERQNLRATRPGRSAKLMIERFSYAYFDRILFNFSTVTF